MEQHIRRLNLSFDMRRDKDRQVYTILQQHQNKTAFVINTVLGCSTGNQITCDKSIIKQAVREALMEYNIDFNKDVNEKENNVIFPNEVFNIFESL